MIIEKWTIFSLIFALYYHYCLLPETSKLLNEPERLEKLWTHKTVREKKVELEKSLEKLKKKYDKVN